ncbi:MAG: ROK family protein [Planctomycetota bacterium]|jgi:glucokinase
MSAVAGSNQPVIGIDLGATNMNLAVIDANDRILARAHQPTDGASGLESVLDRLAAATRRVAADADLDLAEVGGIGVAVASPVDVQRGIALHAVNLGWRDVPLRDLLQERLRRPVVIDNDVNGAVWGEYCLGAGRDGSEMLGVWVGTGVGGGLVLNGRLYHGSLHSAGEIGQTVLDPDGAPDARTVEQFTSRTGMSRLIRLRLADFPDSRLRDAADERGIVGADRLGEAWRSGDDLATLIVEEAASRLGTIIANCVTLLALDSVVVGGGVTEALGPPYLELLQAGFESSVFPDRCRDLRLVMTRLQSEAGLLGAALLARQPALSADA